MYHVRKILLGLWVVFAVAGVQAAELGAEQKAAIVQQCKDLSVRYVHAIDNFDHQALAALFTEQGVWDLMGHPIEGRQAIGDMWKSKSEQMVGSGLLHVISNELIEVVDADHANGQAYFMIYKFNPVPGTNESLQPVAITISKDEYIRTEAGWKIQRRAIMPLAATASDK